MENKDTKEAIKDIDLIFDEFLVEEKYKLQSRKMDNFILKIVELKDEWIILKELINEYHIKKDNNSKIVLIEKSEHIWNLSEDAVLTLSEISLEKTYMLNNIFLIFLVDFILVIFVIHVVNNKIRNKLEILSSVDPLTNAKNRNSYNDLLALELEFNKRHKYNTGYIILDIDKFKYINDTFGHDIGDMVLKELVLIVQEVIRKSDILFRIGGEEFVIFARGIKKENLENLANKIRLKVEEFDSKISHKFTISIGATMFNPDDTKDTIFKRADEALYISKNSGRNRVTVV